MIDRDTIIKLAQEARVFIPRGSQEGVAIQELERFTALVAAEREQCAKVCETEWTTNDERVVGAAFADAIRARNKE